MNKIVQQSTLILNAVAGEGLTGSVASWLVSGRAASAALEACTFQKLFLIFGCLEPLWDAFSRGTEHWQLWATLLWWAVISSSKRGPKAWHPKPKHAKMCSFKMEVTELCSGKVYW